MLADSETGLNRVLRHSDVGTGKGVKSSAMLAISASVRVFPPGGFAWA